MSRGSEKRTNGELGRSESEVRENARALADEVPRGKGASSAKGQDVNGREELAEKIAQGVDRRRWLGVAATGALGVGAGLLVGKFGSLGGLGGGASGPPGNLDAQRIAGVRIATEFDNTKHTGTATDPWSGAAIQAAIDDILAAGLGGKVFVPAGQWDIQSAIRTFGGITVEGAGMGNWEAGGTAGGSQGSTVLRVGDNTGTSVFVVDDAPPPYQYWANLRDLSIDGNSANNAVGSPAIDYKLGAADGVLENLFIRYCRGDGILLQEGFNMILSNVWSEGGYGNAITCRTGIIRFSRCFLMSSQNGLVFDMQSAGANMVTVTECQIIANAAFGIAVQGYSGVGGSTNIRIEDSIIAANGSAGVYIDTQDGSYVGQLRIQNNEIFGLQEYGIRAFRNLGQPGYSMDLYVDGNNIRDTTTATVDRGVDFPTRKLFIRDNPGVNPIGTVASPFDVDGSFYRISPFGTSAAPTSGFDYTAMCDVLLTVTGGAGVSIALKDPNGAPVTVGSGSLAGQYVPAGYRISINYSSIPTISVFFV